MMAEEEPLLVSPPTQDVAVHVRDYERFTKMFKWGAITALIVGLVVLLILKS
jgi:Bacterial aa3 type cytochrome c oxidase subunit IV